MIIFAMLCPVFAQILPGVTPETMWTVLVSLTGPTLVAIVLKLIRDNVPGITIVAVVVPITGILIWLGSQYLGISLTGNMWVDFVLQVLIGYVTTILGAVKDQLSQGLTRTINNIRTPVGLLGDPKK